MATPPRNRLSPISLATEWVSRILAIAVEMILPGLAGHWLDTRWGTKFLALVGFGLGISLAIYHLLAITKAQNARQELGRTRGAKADPETKHEAGPDRK